MLNKEIQKEMNKETKNKLHFFFQHDGPCL